MPRRLVVFSALLGCDATVALAPPGEGDAILIIEDRGHQTQIRALSRDDERTSIELQGDASKLTYASLGRPLADLGWTAGNLVEVESNVCGARRIPHAGEAFELVVQDGDTEGTWSLTTSALQRIESVRVEGPCACLRFVVEDTLPFDRLAGVLAHASGHLIVGGAYGAAILDETGSATVAVGLEAETVRGIYAAPDGDVYVGVWSGSLYRGRVGQRFVPIAQIPNQIASNGLDGPRDDSPFEIFLLDYENHLYSFNGSEWHPIELPLDPALAGSGGQNGNVLWLEPGRALVTPSDLGNSALVNRGVASSLNNIREVAHVFWLDRLGALGSGRNGGLDRLVEDGWVNIPVETLNEEIRSVTPTDDGFVIAAGDMIAQHFYESPELCAPIRFDGISRVRAFERVGEGFLLLAQTREGKEVILKVRSEPKR